MQQQSQFQHHTNDALLEALRTTRTNELCSTARLLRILEQIDDRWLFAEMGYGSMHSFCVEYLHLSESEAYLRITVARACREFPMIFDMIERNELHLSGAALLSSHLTPENHVELLKASIHQTKRNLEKILAIRFPRRDIADSIRRYALKMRNGPIPSADRTSSAGKAAGPTAALPAPATSEERSKLPALVPISEQRFAVRFAASARCVELLERARALSSHRHPGADLGEIVEEALEAFVEKLEKAKFKTTDQPRKAKLSENREFIPAEVKRAVHARDQGRCTYVGPDGHLCGSQMFLEFDHRKALALGGESTVENVRLLCRTHNQLAARRDFGDQQIELMARGFRPVARDMTSPDSAGFVRTGSAPPG